MKTALFLSAAAKNHTVTFLLVVVPLLAVGVYVAYLRKPEPRVRTPVMLNRNSLLPHRFAGACVNCHRIEEVGPTAMNRDNMQLFSISPADQRLLLAGQRVEVPSLLQQLRMPAILRNDPLPHSYVGVCSNCHVIMNARPSRRFLARAMDRAYQPITALGLGPEQIARGGARERHTREIYRNILGYLALILLGVSCVYIAMRVLMASDPKRWKGKFKIRKWFTAHEWCASAFCVATIGHWYFSDRGNNFLHLALWVVVWLTLAGYVLRYRWAQKQVKQNVRLLHSQRFLFFGLLGLIAIGHLFAAFE